MAEPKRQLPIEDNTLLRGARILIVEARYYDDIGDALLEGAVAALDAAGVTHTRINVPGALEIPGAIALAFDAAKAGGVQVDGAVALGCVIRGETYHFEIVAGESSRGLMDLTMRGLPIGNGILTVENEAQAFARARKSEGDKGGDAARAALSLLRLKRMLAKAGRS
jgi:6,7-dimethyl-8-ribityllumazine synthase